MPVLLRAKGFKFWFYEADLDEPPHVHVGKGGKVSKFWLEPVKVARKGRFKLVELRDVEKIIIENQRFLLSAWEREISKRADH
jgi:hypothetical protein